MKIGLVAALNFNTTCPTLGKVHVPLGLLCLGALLEAAGYEVEIVDPNLFMATGEIPFQAAFEEEIAKRIAQKNFDAVGFSSLANTYHQTLKTIKALRTLNAEVPIILGGPQATHTDIQTLEAFEGIDAIVRGEGELAVLDLLKALAGELAIENVRGITYRREGRVVRNEDAPLISDINELPFPAYKLYPIKEKSDVPLDAGRGCPYHCNFCSTCVFWKHRFRQKNPKRIADEMQVLKYLFGARSVDFTHDLFTLDRKNVVELCRNLRRRKLNMPWSCSTRIDAVDGRLLLMMAKAGCRAVYYGVESGSARMQEIIGKGFDTAIVKKIIMETIDAGIDAIASFIIGFPEETEEDLKKTIDMVFDLLGTGTRVNNVQIHLLAVTNATRLWEQYSGELRYDGVQSDQVSGGLFYEDDPIIKAHPKIFPGHYYVENPAIERDLLIDLHILGFAANTIWRWSLVAAARKAQSGFLLAKGWHDWRKKQSADGTERQQDFAERLMSVGHYLKADPDGFGWKDEIFETMRRHETRIMKLKMRLVTDQALRTRIKPGDIIETARYRYDPAKIIEWLSSHPKKREMPRRAAIDIEYFYGGWIATGHSIKFRQKMRKQKPRRRHDTLGKRRNTRGNRGGRVPSLSRREVHRKNKRGTRRRRAQGKL